MSELADCTGFQWDEGNSEKNWIKHRVTRAECEQVFSNQPLVVGEDEKHSQDEPRSYALGRTDAGRRLFVAFTIRGDLVRVISTRDVTEGERRVYGRAEEEADTKV